MNFLEKYFDVLSAKIKDVEIGKLEKIAELLVSTGENFKKVIVAGNGGSAAIASHISVDLTRASKVRAVNFNEADLITCFANDYGYDRWLEKAIEAYADKGDTAILISSSGKSRNIVNAAIKAKELGLNVVTLSGFDSNNPLRKKGDIDLWVDSSVYNVVETIHNIWLAAIVDEIVNDAMNTIRTTEYKIPIVALASDTVRAGGKKLI